VEHERFGGIGRGVALGFAVLLLAMPAGAFARLPPGVHVDPGSPAGKEYGIPLSQARGGGDSGSRGLFGSGITRSTPGPPPAQPAGGPAATASPKQPRAGAHSRTRATTHPRSHRGAGQGHQRSSHLPRALARQPKVVLGSSSGSGTGILWMAGVGALVLVLGGIGGAAIGRRGRRTTPGVTQ
jgi:hypothetical protein